jgi:hypothetical protein
MTRGGLLAAVLRTFSRHRTKTESDQSRTYAAQNIASQNYQAVRAGAELRLAAEAITPSMTLSAIRDKALKRQRGNDWGHLTWALMSPSR